MHRSLLSTYVADIVKGRQAKRELTRIAKKNPKQVLASFKQLPSADQRDFHWIRVTAVASLEKQGL